MDGSRGLRRYDTEYLLWQSTVVIKSDPVGFVSGTWTLTSGDAVVGVRHYSPRVTVETLVNGEWVAGRTMNRSAYTVDKAAIGDGRIRITWTWDVSPGFLIIVR
jgi:hypothetical protein